MMRPRIPSQKKDRKEGESERDDLLDDGDGGGSSRATPLFQVESVAAEDVALVERPAPGHRSAVGPRHQRRFGEPFGSNKN